MQIVHRWQAAKWILNLFMWNAVFINAITVSSFHVEFSCSATHPFQMIQWYPVTSNLELHHALLHKTPMIKRTGKRSAPLLTPQTRDMITPQWLVRDKSYSRPRNYRFRCMIALHSQNPYWQLRKMQIFIWILMVKCLGNTKVQCSFTSCYFRDSLCYHIRYLSLEYILYKIMGIRFNR